MRFLMGLFTRKKTKRGEPKHPHRYLSLEECQQEISRCKQEISRCKQEISRCEQEITICEQEFPRIEHKKRDLEHRLEILSKTKPVHTILVTEDTLFTPTTIVEEQIELIMTELRRLDSLEETYRLLKDDLEKARKEKIDEKQRWEKIIAQEHEWTLAQIDVKPILGTKDLCGEIVLSRANAFHGVEKAVQYVRDGEKTRIKVKIPPGVRDGMKIKCRGQGLIADPPGDLILIIRIAESQVHHAK
jgi:hypothetical protein